MCTFSSIRNCQIVFPNGYFILHLSPQWWEFQLLYILANTWHCSARYLVVLICISLCLVMLSIFSCVYCLFFGEVSVSVFCLYVVLFVLYRFMVLICFEWHQSYGRYMYCKYIFLVRVCVCALSCVSLPDSTARHLCPWNFPGKNTGAGCCIFLQGIFLTQGWNLRLVSSALAGGFFPSWATKGAVSQYCDLVFHFLGRVF